MASCNILAMNNNPLETFPKRLLFCDENNLLGYMYQITPANTIFAITQPLLDIFYRKLEFY